MNKLRLIRIYELRGKIHPIEQWVINLLDGVEEEIYPGYIEYRKDGISYFNYYLIKKSIYLHIYYDIEDNFGCPYVEIIEIMKYLLDKHLDITINDVI